MSSRWTLVLGLSFVAIASTRAAAPAATYGKGVTLGTATPLGRLLANPSPYDGKTVRVEGVVTAVCEEMGCWMALGMKDAAGEPTLMVKVEDGVIVFPVSAKGKRAAAQGVMHRIKADDHEGNEAAKEKAQAAGSAKANPADNWLMQATGAVVY